MAETQSFQHQSKSSWPEWEQVYLRAATGASWPQDMIDTVLGRMKMHHDEIMTPDLVTFELPAVADPMQQLAVDEAVANGIRKLEGVVRSMLDDIFIRLFDLEVALYKARH